MTARWLSLSGSKLDDQPAPSPAAATKLTTSYPCLSKVSANQRRPYLCNISPHWLRRHHVCNVSSHWLRPCLARSEPMRGYITDVTPSLIDPDLLRHRKWTTVEPQLIFLVSSFYETWTNLQQLQNSTHSEPMADSISKGTPSAIRITHKGSGRINTDHLPIKTTQRWSFHRVSTVGQQTEALSYQICHAKSTNETLNVSRQR